jgi:predicted AlkP superfamily phosphohydrolase/phosphomutase
MPLARRLIALLALVVVGGLLWEESVGTIRIEWNDSLLADADSAFGLLRLLFLVWIVRLVISWRGAWRPGAGAWIVLLSLPALYFWLDADERIRRGALSVTASGLIALLIVMDVGRRGGPWPGLGRAVARVRPVALTLLAVAVVLGVGWIGIDRYRYDVALDVAEPTRTSGAPSLRPETRLLLIGLDGATWSAVGPLIEAGELPNLARLVAAGHSGPLNSRQTWRPSKEKWGYWSPVSWTMIATGYTEDTNGVVDFTVPVDPDKPDGRHEESARKHWRALPFWEVMSLYGVRSSILGWWATWPAQAFDGELVTLKMGLRVGNRDSAAVLREYAEHPDTVPEGHMSPRNLLEQHAASVRSLPDAAAFDDLVRARFMDFDRNDGVEPSRENTFRGILWQDLFYKELARSALREGSSRLVSFYAEGTDTTQHYFWQYRGKSVEENAAFGEQPERLRDAVDNYYRLADEWVGELLEEAGPEWNVLVISDHGHHDSEANKLRKSDHEGTGLYIAAGPDFRQGRWPDAPLSQRMDLERDHPANFDIAPTILYLFGVPLAADRDGRVLTPLFRPELIAAQPLAEVPTWTHEANALVSSDVGGDEYDREAGLERLRQLGYIDG